MRSKYQKILLELENNIDIIKAEEENPKEIIQELENIGTGIFGSESKNIGKINRQYEETQRINAH